MRLVLDRFQTERLMMMRGWFSQSRRWVTIRVIRFSYCAEPGM